MSREDQYNVTVSIDGRDLGTFDKMEGGEVDSEEAKYKPGGMVTQISLGGSVNVENVTVSRLYDLERDHSMIPWMIERVGKGQVTVSKQHLDVNSNAFGKPTVYKGVLKQYTPPAVDSESNDAGIYELEVSTAGSVG